MIKILIILIICFANNVVAQNIISKIELLDDNIFTFIVNNKPKYNFFILHNPKRLVIDVTNTQNKQKTIDNKSSIVDRVRYGIRNGLDVRFVLEIKENFKLDDIESYLAKSGNNYKLHISLGEIKSKDNPQVSSNYIIKNENLKIYKPTIIIDAGHGGEDPGTIGRYTNIYEKNITLSYAKTLARLLERTKLYNVILTRNDDKFLTLSDRVDKARIAKADLFISLHADSHADPRIQGLSVYTLSEDLPIKKIDNAKKQLNIAKSKGDKDDIKEILTNLINRKNRNLAIEFAGSLIKVMGKEVAIVKNSHRLAGLKVLRNEEVPAVLIELGYLSNKQEEKLLQNDKYRSKLINALIMAINHHFDIS